jgi:Zn-finger nucleic acid-binding protein
MSDRIKCPVCAVDMLNTKCHQIEIDRCPKCKGIWFDILEHEDLRKIKGSAQEIDSGARNVKLDSEGKIIDCPRCHTRMSPTHDSEQPHIVYEKCSHCSGVFFDAGEFTDLQEFTLAEKLKYWAV